MLASMRSLISRSGRCLALLPTCDGEATTTNEADNFLLQLLSCRQSERIIPGHLHKQDDTAETIVMARSPQRMPPRIHFSSLQPSQSRPISINTYRPEPEQPSRLASWQTKETRTESTQSQRTMASTALPPVLQSKCTHESEYTKHPSFIMQYEKHLNEKLANYHDPEAHQGLSSDLHPVTGTRGNHTIRRGWKFRCGVALWGIIILGLICVGSLLSTASLRKQRPDNPEKDVEGRTTVSIVMSTMKQAASDATSFYGTSMVLSASAKDIHLSTRTAKAPAQLTWTETYTPYTSMASTSTPNVPSVSDQTAMQSISRSPVSKIGSQVVSTNTTMIMGSSIPGTFMPSTMTSSSISTLSVSPMESISFSVSSSSSLSSVVTTVRPFTTDYASSGTSTSSVQATRTSHGGLVGFCGTLGMACTEKPKRGVGDIAEEPAAIAILKSALAMFSSTSILSGSTSRETLTAVHTDPTTTVKMLDFTTLVQMMASAPSPDPVSSTENASPVSISGLRSGAPVVGFCGIRGMACLK
nr:hypothetical protein CFP56_00225 [Quercus suber]